MRSALFGPVYRCGVFATWIDVVRRCKIIFLPTISSNFCLVPQLGPQKGAKSALRGHQPIDFRPFRTPSRGIAAFSHDGHFSPTDRSLHLYHVTRKTNDAGPDRIVDTFVPFNGLPDLLYEKERCDRNHHGIWWTTTVPVQEALSALLDGLTGEPDKTLMMWSVRKLFCTS